MKKKEIKQEIVSTSIPPFHGFVSGALHYLKGKEVEVCFGNINCVLSYDQRDHYEKDIFVGTLIDGYGDSLLLRTSAGNEVVISAWTIQSMAKTGNIKKFTHNLSGK